MKFSGMWKAEFQFNLARYTRPPELLSVTQEKNYDLGSVDEHCGRGGQIYLVKI
jgi:hypothetical protein